MRRSLALLVAVLAPCALAIPGAGCSSAGNAADASADSTFVIPGADANNGEAEGDGGVGIATTMRLANMSPNLGPVDFCWRVTGAGSFTGPVLGGPADGGILGPPPDATADAGSDASDAMEPHDVDSASDGNDASSSEAEPIEDAADASFGDAELDAPGDGGAEGGGPEDSGQDVDAQRVDAGPPVQVAFGSIGPFVQLPVAGTLDIALVAPHQLSCDQPRFIGQVTLDPGKFATATIMGLLGADAGATSALVIKAFTDEPVNGGPAQLRFIHAALGSNGAPGSEGAPGPLSVQVGGIVVAPDLDPTQVAAASTSPPIDSLGYATVGTVVSPGPLELSTLGDAAPHTWTTPFFEFGLLPGTTHTAFIVSLGAGALGVAWCGVTELGGLPPACVIQPAK
jgi:hypothetical protein